MTWRAGPHSIIGENLVVKAVRIWSPRTYERGYEYPVTIKACVQRDGELAVLGGYRQDQLTLNANESRLITGQNPLNYPLRPGDVLVAEWDQRPVAGVIVEFQLTRTGGVSEPVVEERQGVIGGRDISRPLFSAHAQDEESVARLARQINESGVPDVSIPIYLWDVPAGTPYVSLLLPEGHVFDGGGAIEVVPYSVIITQSEEKIWLPDLGEWGRFTSTIDSVHILTATLKLLAVAINTDIKFGLRAHYDDESPIYPGQVVDYWLTEQRVESGGVNIALIMANEFFVRTSVTYEAIVQISGDTNVSAGTDSVDSRASVTQLGSVFAPRGPQGEPGPPGPQGPKGASTFLGLDDTPMAYIDQARKMVAVNDAENALIYKDEPTRWRGAWAAGDYETNDMVLDAGWLMVANKDTNDRPSPQPTGSPYYVYPGIIGTNSALAKSITFGMRYTFTVGGYSQGYRVYTVTGNRYRIFVVVDGVIDEIIEFVADTPGWTEFSATSRLVAAGTTFDLLAMVSEPDPTPTVWSGNYDYTTPQNYLAPAIGEISHSRSTAGVMSINKVDEDAIDRSAQLLALSVGDIIAGANTRWSIQSISDQGSYVDFAVAPAANGSPIGVQQFDFETVTPTPISYGEDVDYWLGDPNKRGLLGIDTAYEDIVPDDNQYGIDLFVQQADVSEDWDLMSSIGGASSGGGGGVDNFLALLDTPGSYAGEAGKVAKVNPTEDALIFVADSGGGGAFQYEHVIAESYRATCPNNGSLQNWSSFPPSWPTTLDPTKTYCIELHISGYVSLPASSRCVVLHEITRNAGRINSAANNHDGTANTSTPRFALAWIERFTGRTTPPVIDIRSSNAATGTASVNIIGGWVLRIYEVAA